MDKLSALHLNFPPPLLPTSEPENEKRAMLVVFSSKTVQASLLAERFQLDWNELPGAIIGDLHWSDSDDEAELKEEFGQVGGAQADTLGASSSDAQESAEPNSETREERHMRRQKTRRVLSSATVVFTATKSETSQNMYCKTHQSSAAHPVTVPSILR